MTTPTHGLYTYVLTSVILNNWKLTRDLKRGTIEALASLSGTISMLPDLIPLGETLRGNWGNLYEFFHSFSLWSLIPQIGLHQLIDYFTHDQITGGWLWVGYVLEVLAAAVSLVVVYAIHKSWIFYSLLSIFVLSYVLSFII